MQADRARLLSALPAGAADRGVYVLRTHGSAYPGSRFDTLLPTADGRLLVEADSGPVALVSGLPAKEGELALVEAGPAGRTAVLAEPSDQAAVAAALSGTGHLDPRLDGLARSTAPFAWAGPVGGSARALVTFDGTHVRAEITGAGADDVRTALAGSLPGSPGKAWSDVVSSLTVTGDDPVIVDATARDLPAALLRELLDELSGSAP